MKKAKRLFSNHSEEEEVHVTSDGHHFFNPTQAGNHAGSLKDKKVTTITRAQAEAWQEDEDQDDASDDSGQTEKAPKKPVRTPKESAKKDEAKKEEPKKEAAKDGQLPLDQNEGK